MMNIILVIYYYLHQHDSYFINYQIIRLIQLS